MPLQLPVEKVTLDHVDPDDRPEDGVDEPAVERRSSREPGFQQPPDVGARLDPREGSGAEEVEDYRSGNDDSETLGRPVALNDHVAEAQRLAGLNRHLDDAVLGLSPALERRRERDKVVPPVLRANSHAIEVDVPQGRGRSGASREVSVVAQVIGDLARVVLVHVRHDALLAGIISGGHFEDVLGALGAVFEGCSIGALVLRSGWWAFACDCERDFGRVRLKVEPPAFLLGAGIGDG